MEFDFFFSFFVSLRQKHQYCFFFFVGMIRNYSGIKPLGSLQTGAPATVGEKSGRSTLVCNKVSKEGRKATKLHCIIHH